MNRLVRSGSIRCLALTQCRRKLSLPAHIVVPMPALSPTMEAGTISKWCLAEGDKFEPGTAICEVETDKATVTFDATEDGFIAKILVGAGEIKVGQPIFVQVEEQDSVKAFADFKSAAVPAAPVAVPAPAVAAPAPVVAAPAPVVAKRQEPKPAVAAPVASSAHSIPAVATQAVRYGTGVSRAGVYKKMAAEQKAYSDKYGRSGHKAL